MNNEFLPYEQALALKELGFDEPCITYFLPGTSSLTTKNTNGVSTWAKLYSSVSKGYTYKSIKNTNTAKGTLAPLYQQAFRWFREKHELHSWITVELGMKLTYCWVITGENKGTEHKANFKTYEEAELECLKKLIEIVNQNKEDE
jgi:hypothetical protein